MAHEIPKTRVLTSVVDRIAPGFVRIDRNGLLAVVDQGVVSGMSLVASVIVGRACGADGLGVYALAVTILVLATAVHTSIISTPYTVFRRGIGKTDEKRFAGSVLFGSSVVMLLSACVLLLASPVFYYSRFPPSFEFIILTVAILIPFLMLRDFARRYCFAHLKMGSSVRIDGAAAIVQLAGLGLLVWYELLTPANAFLCLGAASGISAVVWLMSNRANFVFDRKIVRDHLSKNWRFGRWLLLERCVGVFSSYVIPWLLVFLIDSTATGIFAACMVVVNVSSPFIQGMGNSLSPRFAAAASGRDKAPLQRLWLRSTLFMTSAMAAFVLGCVFAAEALLAFLYDGDEYTGYGMVVIVLALRAMCGTADVTAHHALLAMEKPLPSLYCGLFGLLTTAMVGLMVIPVFGVLGGAIAMLIGTIVEVIIIYWGYVFAMRSFHETINS